MQVADHPLRGWIPYRFLFEKDAPLVQWLYVGESVFDDPFFEESVAGCQSHTYNSSRFKCVSSLENMMEWAAAFATVPVTFVFHVSRCGSTLLSQLISLNQNYTVLSEVPFFDEILRLPYKIPMSEEMKRELLRAAITLIGRSRRAKAEHLFIKTDSWHIAFYKTVRQLYPASAFILLYRSPGEVVASHQKRRGMQAVPGLIEPEIFGLSQTDLNKLSLDAYTAKVLEKYMLMFEELSHDPKVLLIDYQPEVMRSIKEIGNHLNITWDEEHIRQMEERSKFHSKYPNQGFIKDARIHEEPGYLKEAMRVYNRLQQKAMPA